MNSLLNADEEIAKIYERQVDTVYRVCFSFMKNASDAEDMTQETFLKLISCKRQFESEEHEKAWLIVTASNTCKDELRRWKRRMENMTLLLRQGNTVQREDNGVLEQVLELPVKYRQVIYLHYYEGYRTAEIADMLHCPESTIRNQLLRGRKLLKRNNLRGARTMAILAAVLAGSLFVTTAAYAVYFYRLRDLGVGKEMVLDLSGQDTEGITWEEIPQEEIPVREADIITLGAAADSPEYRACSEWREFLREYDTDGAILSKIGNGTTGLQEEYSLVYGCYSREMADKVDEICTEFGLSRLTGFYLAEDYSDLCGRAGIGDVCCSMSENVSWEFYNGYLYDDGTFHMEGRAEIRKSVQGMQESVSWVSDYQMVRTMKGSFNPLTLNVGAIEGYREWNYVTTSGEPVLLANSSEKALIITERQNSLIVVNVLGNLSEDTFEVSDKMLEEMAEAFDFLTIP